MFAFSAPGDSPPPPPKNTHGATSNTRRDVSVVHHGVTNTQAMISNIHNMLKSREGIGGPPQLVSIARTLSLTEYTLTGT